MKFVDLTMTVNENTPVYPGDPKPEFKRIAYCETDGWNEHRICANTHFGTHIDSPWHMLEEGKRLTDFSIDKFIGRAIILDVRGQSEIDTQLSGVEKDDIVFLRTDHTLKANSPAFFDDNPVISMKLAEALVDIKVKMVGIDSYSPDNPPFAIHKIFMKHDILILENLVNLAAVPSAKFMAYVLPIKYERIDGAPCRVIAQV